MATSEKRTLNGFRINGQISVTYTAVIRRYTVVAVNRRQLHTATPGMGDADIVHLFYVLTAIGGCWWRGSLRCCDTHLLLCGSCIELCDLLVEVSGTR